MSTEPVTITKPQWQKLLGGDTYEGDLLSTDVQKTLAEEAYADLEAARILKKRQEVEEANTQQKSSGKWVFRETYDSFWFLSWNVEEEWEYEAQEDIQIEIELYRCSGCHEAHCTGQCLKEGHVFYDDVEKLTSGEGVEIYPRCYEETNIERLRHEVLKKYGLWDYPAFEYLKYDVYAEEFIGGWTLTGRWVGPEVLNRGEDRLLADITAFAEVKGIEAPTNKEVWIERPELTDDYGLIYIPYIKCKPEFAELVVDMLHQKAIKENE